MATEAATRKAKALTICQPWAWAIVHGGKRVENRTWPTSYRGPLLIHAGKSKAWLGGEGDQLPDGTPEPASSAMVFGAIVGRARLVACIQLDNPPPKGLEWVPDHPFAEGPWCWVLDEVEALPTPIPYRGALGLFDVPLSVLEEARRGE